MPIYAQHFTRMNFRLNPPLQEEVCVVFETDLPDADEGAELEAMDALIWGHLWKQYPLWACPYHQGNPPPTDLAAWRHGFCSPHMHGPLVRVDGDLKFYRKFRHGD
jgi:hypothetical protein